MAEFGPSVTEAPETPSFTTAKEGVVEPSILEPIANIFKGVKDLKDKQNASKQEAFLTDFTNKQLALIQAVDQGSMTSQFARTKIRANLATAVSTHHGLRDELIKVNGSILGTAGLGSIVDKGTKEEIRRDKAAQKAVDEGWVSPNASDSELDHAIQNRALFEETGRRYEMVNREIALKRSQAGLTVAENEALASQEDRAAKDYLQNSAPALYDNFNVEMERALAAMNSGDMNSAEVVQYIEAQFVNFEQQLATPLSQVDSHYSNATMKSYKNYKDILVKRAKGEYTQEEYERRAEAAVTFHKSKYLESPAVSAFVAATELVGDNVTLLPNKLDVLNEMSNYYNGNGDNETPTSNLFIESGASREALNSYLGLIGQNPNSLTDVQKEEQASHLMGIFSGIEDYESFLAKNPTNGVALVNDWMSTQDFYRLRVQNPELFPDTSAASRVLQSHYGDEVWGMVKREFTENSIVSVGETTMEQTAMGGTRPTQGPDVQTPTPDSVTYRSTSGGMEFYAVDPSNIASVSKASKLNKQLGSVINKNVKAFAHLDGSNDYAKYWEQISEQYITGGAGDAEVGGSEGGDQLTLESFQTGTGALDSAMTTGGFVGSGDYQNASTPEEVAASFIGFHEGEEEEVLSSFIKQTTGGDINPRTTAWCAAFTNAALGAKGIKGTGSNLARSFLEWGSSVEEPEKGDVAVFERGNSTWQGHVGFYVGPSEKEGFVRILGGNQGDTVSIKDYPESKLLGYRRS